MNYTPLVFDALSEEVTVRDYARSQGITIQTAYRRIWDGRVPARQIYGRWLITQERSGEPPSKTTVPKSQAPHDVATHPKTPQESGNQEHANRGRTGKDGGH
jgi:hypothetical protein